MNATGSARHSGCSSGAAREISTSINPACICSKGEWALCFVNAANLDSDAFSNPFVFSLHPVIPSGRPGQWNKRSMDDYLLFGIAPQNSGVIERNRLCRGRDTIALDFLIRLLRKTATLPGLRKVPGPNGEVQELLRVPIGLNARFARH